MKRDSFIFRGEWKEALSGLPSAVRLEVYEAVIEYGCSGTLPTLKPMSMLAFNFMKTAIDRDQERYEAVSKEKSDRARRNAAARWGAKDADASDGTEICDGMQTMRLHANDATACDCMQQHNEMQLHKNDAIYDNDSVSDNDIIEKGSKEPKKKAASAAERAEAVVVAATKKLEDEVAAYDYPEQMKAAFVSYWTEPNSSRTRVKYQMERTWDTKRRLATWASREKGASKVATKPTEIGRTEFSHDYNKTW